MSQVPSTALRTDRYELTMLDAARRSGRADDRATFEVFTRRLPPGRGAGVFAGLGRLVEAIEAFRFTPEQLDWLRDAAVVTPGTLEWLSSYRFGGHVDAYAEGEWYTAGSPVLTVEGSFAEAVLLETICLSILNHDCAVAAAASLIAGAAGDRPVIEMGSRRTDPDAAVAASVAAWIAGFASTSNLEAGRRAGVPTAGTAAHAFVLAFASEAEAFAAQVAAAGTATTLLVDTYDIAQGIRTAVEVAGPSLGAVRIDSGDPHEEAVRARRLLDALGATGTRIVVTGDLDDVLVAKLADAPIDGYGVGTNVVTGLGRPTAGFVYKLVSIGPNAVEQHPVSKRSAGKETVGGRKVAWRARSAGFALDADDEVVPGTAVLADVVTTDLQASPPVPGARRLQHRVIEDGRVLARTDPAEARRHHASVRPERAPDEPLVLVRAGR